MFIAMNRFRVTSGSEEAFERLWLDRDVHLRQVPGFEEFHMLKGPRYDDHVLYSSHTIWQSRADFENWTRSDAFRNAHRSAGQTGTQSLYLGPPQFEGFEVIQTIGRAPEQATAADGSGTGTAAPEAAGSITDADLAEGDRSASTMPS